jgi:UDP-N-acetylglucosamine diphosphorylase / glucose-1-phosphate thymidylyltransferase / UDP-N-acetylgalactosamine diphosphorylase / glucosamine-1-phosphate N-acetyltransferase / galactosamine-1-phosphate N-acetyltransferase
VTALYLYDDSAARALEPFALTRPACELRAGALLLRERWERAFRQRAEGVVTSAHLADFDEPWGVPVANGRIPRGSVLANSRCAVSLGPLGTADVLSCAGRIAAVRLHRDVDAVELADGATTLERLAREGAKSAPVGGRWIDHVWDFIAYLAPMLVEDIHALASGEMSHVKGGAGMKHGDHPVLAEAGATVEPNVFFDTSAGPVLVRRGATLMAFTRIVGPCVIGEESQVGGDRIANASIGNVCKVHGEVSSTIFLGHCNKGHDGFVGHSYLGRWVNLGAGTTTSNLKNTYGPVQLWTPSGERDTGQQFLGTFFGDHAKTGIGMTLNTGTVIGAASNLYGGVMPPRAVPPFAWGSGVPWATYRVDKFLEVASRMMQRRHVELSAKQAGQLRAAFDARWSVEA